MSSQHNMNAFYSEDSESSSKEEIEEEGNEDINNNFLRENKYISKPTISIIEKPKKKNNISIQDKFVETISNKSDMKNLTKGVSHIEKKLEKNLEEKYGIGYKILKKAGYKIGSGLGANEQGMTDPIEIKKRKKNAGITTNEEFENPLKHDKKNNFVLGRKREKENKIKEEVNKEMQYFESIINEFKTNPNNEDSLMKLLSKINKDKKIIKGYKVLSHAEKKKLSKEKLKEYYVDLLDHTKQKVSDYLIQFFSNNNNKIVYEKLNEAVNEDNKYTLIECEEKEKLNNELLNNKNKYIPPLIDATNIDSSLHSIQSFISNYLILEESYPKLYKYSYSKLSVLCLQKTICSLRELNIPLYGFLSTKISEGIIKISKLIKELMIRTYEESSNESDKEHIFAMKDTNNNDSFPYEKSMRYYCLFLYEIMIKNLILIIRTEWNVLEYAKLIQFFKLYKEIIPKCLMNLISEIISTKIISWLNSYYVFLPEKENLNVHFWIHPWFDTLSIDIVTKISIVLQKKIIDNILLWNIEEEDINQKLISLLSPWKIVFDKKFFNELYKKFFLPKLNYIFEKFEINPNEQKLDTLFVLFALNESEIVPMEKCIEMLKNKFFSKFIKVLDHWLKTGELTKEKKEEIQIWYKGWKELFSKNYLQFEEIKNEFKDALILIYNYTKK